MHIQLGGSRLPRPFCVLPCFVPQHGTEERQQLERRIQSVINKLKVVSYCLTVQLTNTLTRKQLALMCVHSHPFVFDQSGICQAVVESIESGERN